MAKILCSGYLVSKEMKYLVAELVDLPCLGAVRDRTAGEGLPLQPVRKSKLGSRPMDVYVVRLGFGFQAEGRVRCRVGDGAGHGEKRRDAVSD